MGASEKQLDGIQFTNMNGRVTIHDLDLTRADDDDGNSNAFEESFVHNKEYQKEFDNDKKGDENLETNEIQEDHFHFPFQQYHSLLTSSKTRSVMKFMRKLLLEEVDEELNSGMEDRYDDNDIDNSKSKSGVGVCGGVSTSNSGVGIVPTINEEADEDKVEVPCEFDSNFGDAPYWNNGTTATNVESYILSVIATFSNMMDYVPLRNTDSAGALANSSKKDMTLLYLNLAAIL